MHIREGVRRINVLGEVQGEVEQALLTALASPMAEPLEISFYDSQLVTVATLLALNHVLEKNQEMVIIVYHPILASYLRNVGLTCHYKGSKRRLATPRRTIRALALGGSADSLNKIIPIIERLPTSDLVVFVVQHVPKDQPNKLDELLQTKTKYALHMPHHMTKVKTGTIYIAPPGRHLRVHGGLLYLTRDHKHQFAQPSIGVLFDSLAHEYGAGLIAALLCGYGCDGVDEMVLIQKKGGLALVEHCAECQATELVEQAATKVNPEQVLSWREIAAIFAAAARPKAPPEATLLRTFLEAVEDKYGYAFHAYAQGTLQRRIAKLMMERGHKSFYDFQQDVLFHPLCFERLFVELAIGVTEFFRHPKQMVHLRQELLPYLHSFPFIRIWVAGCASGETVYALAILLEESKLLDKVQIYATDINPIFLEQARHGIYGCQGLQRARENYRMSGGKNSFDDYIENYGRFFKIAQRFQKKILFYHHSLVGGGVFNEFQLILCSNVLIYFSEVLQTKLMKLFAKSLHQDGFLMLGPKESIRIGGGERFFQVENGRMKSYRWKPGVTVHAPLSEGNEGLNDDNRIM